MVILNGIRRFQRNRDGLSIYLSIDEWPGDIPLPADSSIIGVGETHELLLYPQWRLILEPDHTLEIITGLFKTSLLIREVAEWYKIELKNRGWAGHTQTLLAGAEQISLELHHQTTGARMKINFRRRPTLNDTEIMIQRILKYPHIPSPDPETEAPENLAE